MYKAVNDTLTSSAIAATGNATVTSLPPWMLVGAELQDPKTGQIIAEYPGKGQNISAQQVRSASARTTRRRSRASRSGRRSSPTCSPPR